MLCPLVDYCSPASKSFFCIHVFPSSPQQKGLLGFSKQGSLMMACVACLPALIGADSPSLHLMALTGLVGSIFQMKFQKNQSQKHLKII